MPMNKPDNQSTKLPMQGFSVNACMYLSPGLLMYMWIGLLLLSDWRKSSWAITREATVSSI